VGSFKVLTSKYIQCFEFTIYLRVNTV